MKKNAILLWQNGSNRGIAMDNQITYPYIESFLNELLPPPDAFLCELEAVCRAENIPAAVRPTARLLYTLAAVKQPETILEIGTAAGFSALHLYLGSGKRARIFTIEKDEERFLLARQNFRKYGALDKIKPICGDAEEELCRINERFDMAFIDAAKGASLRYFEALRPKMKSGGLIVTDNVLYGGRTAAAGTPAHKHRTGVCAMRDYLDVLCHTEGLNTAVLPVGDGVALTVLEQEL